MSEFTQVSLPALARRRADGTGPKVLRIGRSVRYRREDVFAWLDSLSEAG
ncbi:helix-turn-helix transcriptional regulator [Microbacterium sp. NPDC089696]